MKDPDCSACGRALNSSHYAIVDGQLHKSCSLCSRVLGEHVFHKIAAFGVWHSYPNRRPDPQSECLEATKARFQRECTSLADVPYSQLAGILPTLPAGGVTCPDVRVLTTEHGEVAAMLEVLRSEAEDDLASREPRQIAASRKYAGVRVAQSTVLQTGRTSYANVRSTAPREGRVFSSENYTGAEMQIHAAACAAAKPPTVLRRRAGVVTPAQTGVA